MKAKRAFKDNEEDTLGTLSLDCTNNIYPDCVNTYINCIMNHFQLAQNRPERYSSICITEALL